MFLLYPRAKSGDGRIQVLRCIDQWVLDFGNYLCAIPWQDSLFGETARGGAVIVVIICGLVCERVNTPRNEFYEDDGLLAELLDLFRIHSKFPTTCHVTPIVIR